ARPGRGARQPAPLPRRQIGSRQRREAGEVKRIEGCGERSIRRRSRLATEKLRPEGQVLLDRQGGLYGVLVAHIVGLFGQRQLGGGALEEELSGRKPPRPGPAAPG